MGYSFALDGGAVSRFTSQRLKTATSSGSSSQQALHKSGSTQ
jgi:hypothetical protein